MIRTLISHTHSTHGPKNKALRNSSGNWGSTESSQKTPFPLSCSTFSLCLPKPDDANVPICRWRTCQACGQKLLQEWTAEGMMIDDARLDRWEPPPLSSGQAGCLEKGWEFRVKTGAGWTPEAETKSERRWDGHDNAKFIWNQIPASSFFPPLGGSNQFCLIRNWWFFKLRRPQLD